MAINRVSKELTEVRTVLSRARTAIDTMNRMPYFKNEYGWKDGEYTVTQTDQPNHDPLHDNIIADLSQVVTILAKYSRK